MTLALNMHKLFTVRGLFVNVSYLDDSDPDVSHPIISDSDDNWLSLCGSTFTIKILPMFMAAF